MEVNRFAVASEPSVAIGMVWSRSTAGCPTALAVDAYLSLGYVFGPIGG